mgnify:CR=1 FL=1
MISRVRRSLPIQLYSGRPAAPLAFLLLSLAAAPAAADSAHQWLGRMAEAMSRLDYRGILIYRHGATLDTLEVAHRHDENGLRERIATLSGTEREIIRRDGEIRCLYPDDRSLVLEGRLSESLFPAVDEHSWESLAKWYRFTLGGVERVAGHEARVIGIEPRDEFRFGYRLWLDEASAMLLRSRLIDPAGQVFEEMTFATIDIGAAIGDDELAASQPLERFVKFKAADDSRNTLPLVRVLTSGSPLPPGFVLLNHTRTAGQGAGGALEHLLFGDGLATVSVYLETLDESDSGVPPSARRGALNIHSRRDGQRLVTVLGEVPFMTLEAFGRRFDNAAQTLTSQRQ